MISWKQAGAEHNPEHNLQLVEAFLSEYWFDVTIRIMEFDLQVACIEFNLSGVIRSTRNWFCSRVPLQTILHLIDGTCSVYPYNGRCLYLRVQLRQLCGDNEKMSK